MNIAEKISDSEAEIMKIIWAHDSPMTYAQIRAVLNRETDWESQTINTLVKRLVNKSALKQEKKEVYYYSALVKEAEYMEAKTTSFIQKVYSGNVKGLLAALVENENIKQEDFDALKEFWEKGRDKDD